MNSRYAMLPVPVLALVSTFALAGVEGTYTTVTESECNEEVVMLPEGAGKIIDTCRLEDGSHKDAIEELKITWVVEEDVIAVHSDSESFTFTLHDALSCTPFGGNGSSPGIIGRGKSYWKSPISCR